MRTSIDFSILSAVLLFMLSCQIKDNESIAEFKPILQNGIDHGPEESLAGFLSYIGANNSDLVAMETAKIIEKYKEVSSVYTNNFYSKAARIRLIREIVERGDYTIETINYLLNELEKTFDTGIYPKETYLLLKEAEISGAVKHDQIRLIANRQYNKAVINFSEWQRLGNLDPTSTELQAKMHINGSTINGLRNSALEKLQYSEKLQEFINDN